MTGDHLFPEPIEMETSTDRVTGLTAVRAMHPVTKVAAYVMVTPEILADGLGVDRLIATAFDRMLHPWKYPDRRVVWDFELFPRWATLCRFGRRITNRWSGVAS